MRKIYLKKQNLYKGRNYVKPTVRKVLCSGSIFEKLGLMPGVFFVFIITIYQWTLSPDHGIISLYTVGRCKFRPTCSQYTKSMIKEHGLMQGMHKSFKQIKRCY